MEIFNKVLQPGTAVIVGYDANLKVKHGVPAAGADCGPSGSIVGRYITTELEWSKVIRMSQRKSPRLVAKKAASAAGLKKGRRDVGKGGGG